MKVKTSVYAFLVVFALSAGACAPRKIIVAPAQPRIAASDQLFLQAEKAFEQKSWDQAMALYQDYLKRFPHGWRVPAALMKVGAIHDARNAHLAAIQVYEAILSRFPESAFADDARYAILASHYAAGQYGQVTMLAAEFLSRTPSRLQRIKILAILGDSHLAMGKTPEAVSDFSQALENAGAEETRALKAKLKQAVGGLTSAQIQTLLDQRPSAVLRGYLIFQLGLNAYHEQQKKAAGKALTEFITQFPDHEDVSRAKQMLNELAAMPVHVQRIIGCLLPLSGPYQAYGNRALKGIELAMMQASQQVDAPAIHLEIKDTGSQGQGAVTAVSQLATMGAAAIIGPLVSPEAPARAAQAAGIPMVVLSQKEGIPEIGDHIFRNFLTPRMQVNALVRYAVGQRGMHRFAILYPSENYGTTFENLFWNAVVASGATITGAQAYNPSDTDFATPIKKLAGPNRSTGTQQGQAASSSVDFEALFLPDAPQKAGLIIPQLAFNDVTGVTLLGTNLWDSEQLINMATDYLQGAVLVDGFFVHSQREVVKTFVEQFKTVYGEFPGYMEAVAYDTATLLFKVLSDPKIKRGQDILEALKHMKPFDGVTGTTAFDASGEAIKTPYLLQVRGKQLVELDNP
jgi:branched-chain amino acid transport system substrate-binding protein